MASESDASDNHLPILNRSGLVLFSNPHKMRGIMFGRVTFRLL